MIRRILAIARNTYRETVRDKILYNLILFALILIFSSIMLGQLTLGNEDKVMLDLGLSSISVFGMLIAIFIGIGLVYKELEKRTAYALLAKPVRRYELILGKYLGLLFTILVNLAIMTVGLELAMLYIGRIGLGGHLRVLPAVFVIFLSLALTTALALFFSTFSSPALSALFTFFLLDHRSLRKGSAEFWRTDQVGVSQMGLPRPVLRHPQPHKLQYRRQPERYPKQWLFHAD